MWLTGEHSEDSCLLSATTKRMCCLGFMGRALGIPKKALVDNGSPCNLTPMYQLMFPDWESYIIDTLPLYSDFMRANDSEMERKEREKAIARLFKFRSIKVKFVGRYPTKRQLAKEQESAH